MKKSILTLLSIIMLVSIVICATAYLSHVIQEKSESADYNQTKEEDYSRHSDLLGNGKTYNIPYIAVFEKRLLQSHWL